MNAAEAARAIYTAALRRLEPEGLVERALNCDGGTLCVGASRFELAAFDQVLVISIGKAGLSMARAVRRVLRPHCPALEVLCVGPGAVPAAASEEWRADGRLAYMQGEHPLPGAGSLAAGAELLRRVRGANRREALVIFAVSGGASALCEHLADDDVSAEDLLETNRVLIGCGVAIAEINALRCALSAIKGGRLAAAAPTATQITLALSDVNPDDLVSLGSGPTLPPSPEDVDRIPQLDVLESLPLAVRRALARRRAAPRAVTVPERAVVHLVASNREAVDAAAGCAAELLGCEVGTRYTPQEPAVEVAAQSLVDWCGRSRSAAAVYVTGGEVLCPVRGTGVGGRSLETALRAAIDLDAVSAPSPASGSRRDIAILCAGTDGVDGNSPAAGAVVTPSSCERARGLGFDPHAQLKNSDAYPLFAQLGDAVEPGPTGNNLRDLRIAVDLGRVSRRPRV